MKVAFCENHPRRSQGVQTVVYVDADGHSYESHYCKDCIEDELVVYPQSCKIRTTPTGFLVTYE